MPNGNIEWYDERGVRFKEVYPNGSTYWYNEAGHLHRDDGPSTGTASFTGMMVRPLNTPTAEKSGIATGED
jgi:hypothetical protein